MRPRYRGLIIAVLGLAALASAVHQIQSGNETPPKTAHSAKDWKVRLIANAQSQRVQPEQVGPTRFHALTRTRPIPTMKLRRMRAALGPRSSILGLDMGSGYFVRTRLGVGIWVLAGHRVTCLFNGHSGAVACDTSANTTRYGLISVSGPSPIRFKHPPVAAVGLVPDGVKAVRLEVLGRSDHVVPVSNNTFALEAHRPIRFKGVIR